MNTGLVMGRRKFLKGATILGGLTALLGIPRATAAKLPDPPRQPEHSGRGYRLTEHVRKYYETARR
jgi:hypothetical protein